MLVDREAIVAFKEMLGLLVEDFFDGALPGGKFENDFILMNFII